jgi:hypothetical protein
MPTTFSEGEGQRKLTFKFSDKWQVYKYDEPIKYNFYNKLRGQNLKAVDFIAVSEENILFMEVKFISSDNESSPLRFSASQDNATIEKVEDKLSAEERMAVNIVSKRPYLPEEISKKMKDTLIGLFAAYRNSDEKLSSFNELIFADKKQIVFIFFLERKGDLNLPENFKPMASNLKMAIEQKVSFLGNIKINVANTQTLHPALGIEVLVGGADEANLC